MRNIERPKNVTVLACMNATGEYIPSFVVFRGVHKRDDFVIGMPVDSEIVKTVNGWINEEAFRLFDYD